MPRQEAAGRPAVPGPQRLSNHADPQLALESLRFASPAQSGSEAPTRRHRRAHLHIVEVAQGLAKTSVNPDAFY